MPLPGEVITKGMEALHGEDICLGPPVTPATLPAFMWNTKGLERILGETPQREVGLANGCGDFKSSVCTGSTGGNSPPNCLGIEHTFLHLWLLEPLPPLLPTRWHKNAVWKSHVNPQPLLYSDPLEV